MVFEFQFWIWICNGGMVVVVGHVGYLIGGFLRREMGRFSLSELHIFHFGFGLQTRICMCVRV